MGPERDMSYPAGDSRPRDYPAYPGGGQVPPRPPLTKRMRRWHWMTIDLVVAAFAGLCDGAILASSNPGYRTSVPVVLLVAAAVFVTMGLRRRVPLVAFGALLILGSLLASTDAQVPVLTFLAAAFVLYTVTVQDRRRTGIAALVLILVLMIVLSVADVGTRPDNMMAGSFVPVGLANIIAWMTGWSVRQRRRYAVTLQHQAASSAVAEERLRIARELHDVVAHSMSVIAVQAGYGQYVIDSSPDGARHALGAIQATSRDALEEMRRMLGVLRQPDIADGPEAAPPPGPAAPDEPAPGLASLERLVTRTGGAGVRVTLEVLGEPRVVAAGVDLSAYRIIQEALTNVVKHAGTAAGAAVSVSYTDADLVIQVTDDGGRPGGPAPDGLAGHVAAGIAAGGTGHGIIGMRERVALCGGTFSAGPLPGGGFQVTATLPLPAAGTLAASEAAVSYAASGSPVHAVPTTMPFPATAPAPAAALAGAIPAAAATAAPLPAGGSDREVRQ